MFSICADQQLSYIKQFGCDQISVQPLKSLIHFLTTVLDTAGNYGRKKLLFILEKQHSIKYCEVWL
jgi:hypothetical protein